MIKVSNLQRGNSVLNYLSQSIWNYEDSLTTDYEVNSSTSILFLSLKFHSCKPEYIHKRINRMKKYKVNILLVHVDIKNYNTTLQELFRTIPLTIVLGFSTEECSRYIQGFNISTTRSINTIRRKENNVNGFLSSFPKVNKNNISMIVKNYSSLLSFLNSTEEEIAKIPGFGSSKAKDITKYLNMPFE